MPLLGDEWIERNKNAYDYLTIPLKVYRWDYWLNNKNYGFYREEVNRLYESNEMFKAALNMSAEKFLLRQDTLVKGSDKYQKAQQLSMRYLLEECPVLVPLWAQTKCEFIIYPRFRTMAMSATYEHFIKCENSFLLREIALKFNHRVKPKKLSFSYIKSQVRNV